ncbi:MAG TPA: tetratricopeptide repeat protein [Jatrophihabitans sp.]|nr:tetratricopeptide repeat protein [Jatrophihabitans sp.]
MRVVTFYSYKGGTGRTLLLANIAVLAARLGQRVVALDLDLEAPGLAYKLLGNVPDSPGFTGWLSDFGRPTSDNLALPLVPISIDRPFVPGGELLLLPAGPLPSLGYLHDLRELQERGLFSEDRAIDALLSLRDQIARDVNPDLLLIDARTGVTTTNAITNRVLADDVVALALDTPEQLDGTRAVLRSLAPLTKPGSDEPLGLHVVLTRIQGRPAEVSSYEWTAEERAKAERVAEFLREPAIPLAATLDVQRVHLLHDEVSLYRGDIVLMRRDDALDATALHVDYLRIARTLLGDVVDASADVAFRAVSDATARQRMSRFFGRPFENTATLEIQAGSTESVHLDDEGQELLQRVEAARQQALNDPNVLPELASLLTALSEQQAQLASTGAAIEAATEAAAWYRALTITDPDRYRPSLADSLHSLGDRLADVGRRAEAVRFTEEAVAIYRELAATTPDRYRSELADSLISLGARLGDLARHEEALTVAQESVAIYRELTASVPDRYLSELARALISLGTRLGELDREGDALPITQESVAIYQELAVSSPTRYRPDLAKALHSLGIRLGRLARHEEALTVAQESVAIYRELTASAPNRYRPELAKGLNSVSIYLRNLARHEEALAVAQESVAIYRELAGTTPTRYRPELAGTLYNLGIYFHDLSRHEDAFAAAQESVATYRELAVTNRDRYQPDLADSLHNLGFYLLREPERQEEAFAAAQESIAIYRNLAVTVPDRYHPRLATALTLLAALLDATNEKPAAAQARAEASALRVESLDS